MPGWRLSGVPPTMDVEGTPGGSAASGEKGPSPMTDVTLEFIDEEESWRIFDDAAKRTLGISGEEFARKWDAGEYVGSRNNDLMDLVILRPASAGQD